MLTHWKENTSGERKKDFRIIIIIIIKERFRQTAGRILGAKDSPALSTSYTLYQYSINKARFLSMCVSWTSKFWHTKKKIEWMDTFFSLSILNFHTLLFLTSLLLRAHKKTKKILLWKKYRQSRRIKMSSRNKNKHHARKTKEARNSKRLWIIQTQKQANNNIIVQRERKKKTGRSLLDY